MAQADRRSESEAELQRVEAVLRACVKLAADGIPFFEQRQSMLEDWILELGSVPMNAMGTKRVIAMARDAGERARSLEASYEAEREAQARMRRRVAELDRAEKGRTLARLRAADDHMSDGKLTIPDHDLRNSGPG